MHLENSVTDRAWILRLGLDAGGVIAKQMKPGSMRIDSP